VLLLGAQVPRAVDVRVDDLAMMRAALGDATPVDIVIADFQMPDMDGAMLGERINCDPHLSQARVVLLTSMLRHGDRGRFAAMGFAGYLGKPVRPRELLACLDRVLARDAHEWHSRSQPIVTANAAHQMSREPRFTGNVLLVEDNAVNQKVARRFLERLGCRVTVAEDGLEGIKAYEGGGHRLVLMDVNMPVMDGYCAARRIREAEGGRTRIPIVALTANAMTGQLERCLEAGMDGLLTKPLDVEHLEAVLQRFGMAMDAATLLDPAPADPAPARPRDPVDVAAFRNLTDGDPKFTADIVQCYVDRAGELLYTLRAAAASGERQLLSSAIHELKGASANVHAMALHDLCADMEIEAAGSSAGELKRRIAGVTSELSRVIVALNGIMNGVGDVPERSAIG